MSHGEIEAGRNVFGGDDAGAGVSSVVAIMGANMRLRINAIVTVAALGMVAFASGRVASAADVSPMPVKAKPILNIPFFTVNDNRLSYAYNFNGTQPSTYSGGFNGVPANGKLDKQVYAFTHYDEWAYGTNLLAVALTKSSHNDPASPCILPGRPAASVNSLAALPFGNCAGATDVSASLRSTFGFNQIFNTKSFTYGPLHNVSLEVGGNAGTYNGYTGSAKQAYVVGLQFAFDLPYKGYFNFAPLYYKEYNHGAFVQCGAPLVFGLCSPDGSKEYDGTWSIETNWYMDLGFLPENMRYFAISGRANVTGPKGSEKGIVIPTGLPTVIEYNTEPFRLTFDLSKAAFGDQYSHQVDVWVAYRYWQNKYGYNHSYSGQCSVGFVAGAANTGSCTESSLNTGVTVKF
jgi:hypothetical protein